MRARAVPSRSGAARKRLASGSWEESRPDRHRRLRALPARREHEPEPRFVPHHADRQSHVGRHATDGRRAGHAQPLQRRRRQRLQLEQLEWFAELVERSEQRAATAPQAQTHPDLDRRRPRDRLRRRPRRSLFRVLRGHPLRRQRREPHDRRRGPRAEHRGRPRLLLLRPLRDLAVRRSGPCARPRRLRPTSAAPRCAREHAASFPRSRIGGFSLRRRRVRHRVDGAPHRRQRDGRRVPPRERVGLLRR